MAEEQEVASAPQEPEVSDDELWESVGEEDASSGSDTTEPAPQETETVAEEEVSQEAEEPAVEEESAEEVEHDWEKRYKDLEKDYHKRNEDSSSYRRESETKFSDLERQLQSLQIERLENKEQLQKLADLKVQETKETSNSLDSVLTDADKQTMTDFEEVMNVVNKIVDHKMKGVENPQSTEVTSKLEEIEKAQLELQQQRFVEYYDKEMKSRVGEDYLKIDIVPEFVEYVRSNTILQDVIENTRDPEKHAWVVNSWLNTDEGRKYRGNTTTEAPKASGKQKQKREVAKSLAKNTKPPAEVDTSDMSDDELWDYLDAQENN